MLTLGLALLAGRLALAAATAPAATHLALLASLAAISGVAGFLSLSSYRSILRQARSATLHLGAAHSDAARDFAFPVVRRYRDLVLGRGDVDWRVADAAVSSRHARLRLFRDGSMTVTDLGSLNGTFVDGRRLSEGESVELGTGLALRLGGASVVEFSVGDSEAGESHRRARRHSHAPDLVEWGLFAAAVLTGLLFLRLLLQTAEIAGFTSLGAVRLGGREFDLAPHFDASAALVRFLIPASLLALLIHLKQRAVPGTSPVVLPVVAMLTFVGHFQAESLSPRLFARAAQAVSAAEAAGRNPSREAVGRLEFLRAGGRQQVVVATGLLLGVAALLAYRRAFKAFASVTTFVGGWMLLHWFLLAGLVVLTLVAGTDLGTGKRLWLKLGPVTLQTIDLCKVLLVCGMASFFHFHLPQMESHPRRRRLLLAACVGLSVLTVAVQRDMGGVVFLGAFAALFYGLVTGEIRRVVLAFAFLIVAGAVAYFGLADWSYASIVHTRVEKALDPQRHDEQLTLATIAVANGGLVGVGFGLGDAARAVPAIQSDFNIVAIAEELGFVGAACILLLYLSLVLALFRLDGPANNAFLRLFQKGTALALGLQVAVIVGGNLSLIPLTGVTLPFISIGGTSYLVAFLGVMAALLFDGSHWEKEHVSWS